MYIEQNDTSKSYKKQYVDGFLKVIENRQLDAQNIREQYAKDIFKNPQKYRQDLKKMLGWPLVDFDGTKMPLPNSTKLSDEDGYSIHRMEFEVLPGLIMTGLLFKLDCDSKNPLVIVQHGGLGTPELISGIYEDTANYNNMLQRVLKYGVNIFAPQLILWDEKYEVPFDRKGIDAQLKSVGSSVTAIEVFGIMRILDYFETQNYVSTLGMVGISYGGFYTLYTAAIDTRIKGALSCAFFNNRDKHNWTDWLWNNSAYMFNDAEIASLVYPRKLTIEIADNDELFDVNEGIKSFEYLMQMSKPYGNDWVDLVVFPGVHEFCKDDEPIQKIIEYIKG